MRSVVIVSGPAIAGLAAQEIKRIRMRAKNLERRKIQHALGIVLK
jgi:hypothetical protein